MIKASTLLQTPHSYCQSDTNGVGELLEFPICATTQNRKALGETVQELGLETSNASRTMAHIDKTAFSMCVPQITSTLSTTPQEIILVGIESVSESVQYRAISSLAKPLILAHMRYSDNARPSIQWAQSLCSRGWCIIMQQGRDPHCPEKTCKRRGCGHHQRVYLVRAHGRRQDTRVQGDSWACKRTETFHNGRTSNTMQDIIPSI